VPAKEDWSLEEWRMGSCAAATAASGSNVGRRGGDGGVRVGLGRRLQLWDWALSWAFVTTSVNHFFF
jgi:hypothetical protein